MLYAVIAISLNFSIRSSNVGEEVKVKLRPVFFILLTVLPPVLVVAFYNNYKFRKMS